MRSKLGQFYLIAAVLIIVIIVGFVTISNYSRGKRSSVKIYDLGDELGIESQNVIDYGTFKGVEMNSLLTEFVESYKNYAGEGKNLYFIFGDLGSLQVKAYEELVEVAFNSSDIREDGDNINVIIKDSDGGEIEYQFDLKAEDNFYFVVSQEIGGEKHVVTG